MHLLENQSNQVLNYLFTHFDIKESQLERSQRTLWMSYLIYKVSCNQEPSARSLLDLRKHFFSTCHLSFSSYDQSSRSFNLTVTVLDAIARLLFLSVKKALTPCDDPSCSLFVIPSSQKGSLEIFFKLKNPKNFISKVSGRVARNFILEAKPKWNAPTIEYLTEDAVYTFSEGPQNRLIFGLAKQHEAVKFNLLNYNYLKKISFASELVELSKNRMSFISKTATLWMTLAVINIAKLTEEERDAITKPFKRRFVTANGSLVHLAVLSEKAYYCLNLVRSLLPALEVNPILSRDAQSFKVTVKKSKSPQFALSWLEQKLWEKLEQLNFADIWIDVSEVSEFYNITFC